MIKPGSAVTYVGDAGEGEFSFLRPGARLFVRAVDADAGTVTVQSPWDSADRVALELNEVRG